MKRQWRQVRDIIERNVQFLQARQGYYSIQLRYPAPCNPQYLQVAKAGPQIAKALHPAVG